MEVAACVEGLLNLIKYPPRSCESIVKAYCGNPLFSLSSLNIAPEARYRDVRGKQH